MKLQFFTGRDQKYIEDYLRYQIITIVDESFYSSMNDFKNQHLKEDCFKYEIEWKIKKYKTKKGDQNVR